LSLLSFEVLLNKLQKLKGLKELKKVMGLKSRSDVRQGVHSRIRKKVRGSAERPRLAVFRSLNHIYAQVIDDRSGKTLATASTTEKALGQKAGGNVEAAKAVGKAIAERAVAAGIDSVVFRPRRLFIPRPS
jgi:large subunit ribosomal protein L18